MGIESAFGQDEVETPEPVIETPPEVQADEPQVETPAIETSAPTPEAPVAEVERSIPLPTFLDLRDKLKAAERERDEFKAKLSPATPAEMPDPYDDPQGFRAAMRREFEAERIQDRLDFSYQLAAQAHGEDKVEEARQWALERAQADPTFGPQLDAQKHPMDWIVRQHAKAADLSEYERDPVAFAKSLLERHGQAAGLTAAPAPVVAAEQQPAVPQPPRSLASAPSKSNLRSEPQESAVLAAFSR